MGTHPIFESDFDCLTASKINENISVIRCWLYLDIEMANSFLKKEGRLKIIFSRLLLWRSCFFLFRRIFTDTCKLNKLATEVILFTNEINMAAKIEICIQNFITN